MNLLDLDVVYRGFFNDYSHLKIGGTKIFENQINFSQKIDF